MTDFDPASLRDRAGELIAKPLATDWPGFAQYQAIYGLDYSQTYPGLLHYLGRFEAGGETLLGQIFIPPGAKATALVCHGYLDHLGIFQHLLHYCLSRGMAVLACDLPGHGLSSGAPASIRSFRQYTAAWQVLADIAETYDLPRQRIMFGQSMGGAISMSLAMQGFDIDRLVLLAPLVQPRGAWWMRPAHGLLQYFMESRPRNFAKSSTDAEFLRFVKETDPLQSRTVSIAWVGAWKRWERFFMSANAWSQPTLVVQGDDDHTVNWRENMRILKAKVPEASLFQLSGARHHLVNENAAIREAIWRRIDQFLDV